MRLLFLCCATLVRIPNTPVHLKNIGFPTDSRRIPIGFPSDLYIYIFYGFAALRAEDKISCKICMYLQHTLPYDEILIATLILITWICICDNQLIGIWLISNGYLMKIAWISQAFTNLMESWLDMWWIYDDYVSDLKIWWKSNRYRIEIWWISDGYLMEIACIYGELPNLTEIWLDMWWIYDEYVSDLKIWWKSDGYLMDIWWIYKSAGNLMEIWWISDGYLMDIWWMYDGYLMDL